MNLPPLVIGLLCLCWLSASEVSVTATCPWEDKDGYTPVLVTIEAIAEQQVELTATLGSSVAYDRVSVSPVAPVRRTLLLPANTGWSGGIEVAWRGRNDAGRTSVGNDGHRGFQLVLLDPDEAIPLPALNKLISDKVPAANHHRGSYHSSSTEPARRVSADLPDRWQGWPAWLTLLTTPAGDQRLTSAQRRAIATWVATGGALFVTTPAQQQAWERLGVRAALHDPAGNAQALLARLRQANINQDPSEHPVPGTDQVPAGWFMTLAIGFALVVGPLNLWWVRRRGKPHLLLVSVPAISVVTCVVLLGTALIAEGIDTRRWAVQVAIIDQGRGQVVAFTGGTWFCGLPPGGLTLDADDRLQPFSPDDWDNSWRRTGVDLELDWRAGQEARGGWMPARVNRQLAITQVRPERRRVLATAHPGGLRLLNGLDVAIQRIIYTDADGKRWIAQDLAPGAEAEARPQPASAELISGDMRSRLGLDAILALQRTGGRGTWTAELAAPLLPITGPVAIDAKPPQVIAIGHTGLAVTVVDDTPDNPLPRTDF